MGKEIVYSLWEGDVLVDKGTSKILTSKYNVDKSALYNAWTHSTRLKRKYRVQREEVIDTCQIYKVFDGRELVFKGTGKEVQAKYGLKSPSLHIYTDLGWLMQKKYRVEKDGFGSSYEKYVDPKKEIEEWEYLYWHLKNLGNTSVSRFDPNKYVDRLKRLGYECRIEERYDYPGGSVSSSTHRKPILHYYVEVVNHV